MSSDAWLAPDTCGVKLTEFEQLVQIVADAASKIEQLSSRLALVLARAGVGTGPAMDVDRVAAWARQVSPELRRRVKLVQDMDRRGLTVGVCRTDGTYLLLPDRFQDQLGQLQGREAAMLLRRAATGDRQALAALGNLSGSATNPYFAQALLQAIGANGLLELAAGLAYQLHLDETTADRHRHLAVDAKNAQASMRLLSDALAIGTDPAGSAPIGEAFLHQLQEAGRAHHHVPGAGSDDVIVGYQSLATILEAQPGGAPFSLRFFQTVGRDMIAFDRQTLTARSLPSSSANRAPLGDLTQHEQLGAALNAHPGFDAVPYDGRTDFLRPLLDAARTEASAQALLDYTPPGGHGSNLAYLLHDRAETWAITDHGAALGGLMVRAMSGSDPVSRKLFKETSKVLAADIRGYLTYTKDHQLSLDDRGGKADRLSGLRPFLGELLRRHLDAMDTSVSGVGILGVDGRTTGPTMREIDALLAEASRDDGTFNALVTDAIGRTRMMIDRQYKNGKGIDNVLITQGTLLGHLLAVRRETLLAKGANVDMSNQQMTDLINKGVGLIPVPYAELFPGVAKDIYQQATTSQYDKIGDWLREHVQQDGGSTEQDRKTANDEDAVRNLFRQMALSAAVDHINSSGPASDLEGEAFESGGRLLPVESWGDSPEAVDQFLRWCKEHNFEAPQISSKADTAIKDSHDEAINSFKNLKLGGTTP